jgi:hypothetical protein
MGRKGGVGMDNKKIVLSKTVYQLCSEYPELPEILAEIGFKDITKPGMIATMGRFMTIQKGAAAKKIDVELIKNILREKGFEVSDH